ncbi:hypothetical protein CBS101457_006173 [Exobasidium rhododendri]|nr:hypothetical protein CBS101457_006173 [Exobasidium rhododendri]
MVRSVTFEIRWHDMQPIYSCSFQPIPPAHLRRVLDFNQAQAAGLESSKILASNGDASASMLGKASSSRQPILPLNAQGQSWRFATAGGDNHARIWLVHPNIPSPAAIAASVTGSGPAPTPNPPRVEYRATLKRHSGVVNCVRFCPKGELLATTGDDGMVLLWIPSDGPPSSFASALDDDGDAEFSKEHWRLRTMSRASSSEIYDMAWSPAADALVIGGTDFVARIINANDGTILREISEHNHYIQGVAWDPLAEYIATQSSDRSVHVHHISSKNSTHEYGGVHTVSRNNRMDLHHRRTGSSNNHFVWGSNAKPPMKRSASSHASRGSDSERETATPKNGGGASIRQRTGRSSTPLDIAAASSAVPHPASSSSSSSTSNFAPTTSAAAATSTFPYNTGRAGTPSPAPTSMNPPQRTPSRRSSFSGSQVEALSPPTSATSFALTSHPSSIAATATSTAGGVGGGASTPVKASNLTELNASSANSRSASRTRGLTPRSPSPAPPLPAIRAPPSPKQRMATAATMHAHNPISSGGGSLAKAGMRLYGDENFSGFFRRLSFSPDGALLVTPTGIFENSSTAAMNQMQSPASPTTSHHPLRRLSDQQDEVRNSPGSPMPLHHSVNAASSAMPPRSTVYLYGRGNLHKSNAPIAHLPGHKTASLVIKFSPILYELRKGTKWNKAEDVDGIAPHPNVPLEVGKQKTVSLAFAASSTGNSTSSSAIQEENLTGAGGTEGRPKSTRSYSSTSSSTSSSPTKPQQQHPQSSSTPSTASLKTNSMIGLPYRMIFAVATHDSVWIYDTQQGGPLCCFSNMHYASFTDLTWSSDGQTLMMCSTDGYCSVVVFDYEELGVPYQYQSQPSLQQQAANGTTAVATAVPMIRRSSSQEGGSMRPQQTHQQTLPTTTYEGSSNLGLGLATGIVEAAEVSLSAAEKEQSHTSAETNARKKRRIAPTLQGPIGS